MIRVVNQHRQPLVLEDGTIIAAADTEGAARDIETLSELDRARYVDTGRLAIVDEVPASPTTIQPSEATQTLSQPPNRRGRI